MFPYLGTVRPTEPFQAFNLDELTYPELHEFDVRPTLASFRVENYSLGY